MVGFTLFDLVRLQAGPTLSLLLSAKEGDKSVREHYEDFTMGYQAGLGVDLWNVMVDLKYEGNLTRFGNRIAGIATDHRPRLFILSVGFKLL